MSREACLQLLAARDRSALVLSKYMPQAVQDGFVALRALNVETKRAVDGAGEAGGARLQYWKSGVQRAYATPRARAASTGTGAASGGTSTSTSTTAAGTTTGGDVPPPLKLLTSALASQTIPKRYLLTLLQTREHELLHPPVRNIEDLARLGEGTASQLLYATFDMLQAREQGTAEYLSANPELDEQASNVLAHIGQAQGIAGSLKALPYYAARQNRLLLPLDVLAQRRVSEQEALEALAGASGKSDRRPLSEPLRDAIFDVATAANDHILAARKELADFKAAVGKAPRSLTLSALCAVPTVLFLERLEKRDFDVRRGVEAQWRLPLRTWLAFRKREF